MYFLCIICVEGYYRKRGSVLDLEILGDIFLPLVSRKIGSVTGDIFSSPSTAVASSGKLQILSSATLMPPLSGVGVSLYTPLISVVFFFSLHRV